MNVHPVSQVCRVVVLLCLVTSYCNPCWSAQDAGQRDHVIGWSPDNGWGHPWSGTADPKRFFDDPGVVKLCQAITHQDLDGVVEALSEGVNADARGKQGATPLMWCMPMIDTGIFSLLLEKGADPNVKFLGHFPSGPSVKDSCVTLLMTEFGTVGSLRTVLDHKGDPNWGQKWDPLKGKAFANVYSSSGVCLKAAVVRKGFGMPMRVAKVRLLLERGADPNVDRPTPILLEALQARELECALVLLAAGAKLDVPDAQDLLPCHYLAELLMDDKLSKADQERVLLLAEKVKKRKAWRPESKVEMAEYRRLEQLRVEQHKKELEEIMRKSPVRRPN